MVHLGTIEWQAGLKEVMDCYRQRCADELALTQRYLELRRQLTRQSEVKAYVELSRQLRDFKVQMVVIQAEYLVLDAEISRLARSLPKPTKGK